MVHSSPWAFLPLGLECYLYDFSFSCPLVSLWDCFFACFLYHWSSCGFTHNPYLILSAPWAYSPSFLSIFVIVALAFRMVNTFNSAVHNSEWQTCGYKQLFASIQSTFLQLPPFFLIMVNKQLPDGPNLGIFIHSTYTYCAASRASCMPCWGRLFFSCIGHLVVLSLFCCQTRMALLPITGPESSF